MNRALPSSSSSSSSSPLSSLTAALDTRHGKKELSSKEEAIRKCLLDYYVAPSIHISRSESYHPLQESMVPKTDVAFRMFITVPIEAVDGLGTGQMKPDEVGMAFRRLQDLFGLYVTAAPVGTMTVFFERLRGNKNARNIAEMNRLAKLAIENANRLEQEKAKAIQDQFNSNGSREQKLAVENIRKRQREEINIRKKADVAKKRVEQVRDKLKTDLKAFPKFKGDLSTTPPFEFTEAAKVNSVVVDNPEEGDVVGWRVAAFCKDGTYHPSQVLKNVMEGNTNQYRKQYGRFIPQNKKAKHGDGGGGGHGEVSMMQEALNDEEVDDEETNRRLRRKRKANRDGTENLITADNSKVKFTWESTTMESYAKMLSITHGIMVESTSFDYMSLESEYHPLNVHSWQYSLRCVRSVVCKRQLDLLRYVEKGAARYDNRDKIEARLKKTDNQIRIKECKTFLPPPENWDDWFLLSPELHDASKLLKLFIPPINNKPSFVSSMTSTDSTDMTWDGLSDGLKKALYLGMDSEIGGFKDEKEILKGIQRVFKEHVYTNQETEITDQETLKQKHEDIVKKISAEYEEALKLCRDDSERDACTRSAIMKMELFANLAVQNHEVLESNTENMSDFVLAIKDKEKQNGPLTCQPKLLTRHISPALARSFDMLYGFEHLDSILTVQQAALLSSVICLNATATNHQWLRLLFVGGPGVGKSFLFTAIAKYLAKRSWRQATHMTAYSDTAGGNKYDKGVTFVNEAKAEHLGVSTGKGNGDAKNSDAANHKKDAEWDTGVKVTRTPRITKDGKRVDEELVRKCGGPWFMASNIPLEKIAQPVLDRFLHLETDMAQRTHKKTAFQIMQANSIAMSRLTEKWIEDFRVRQVIINNINGLIDSGVIREAVIPVTERVLERLFACEEAQNKLPRNIDNRGLKSACALALTLTKDDAGMKEFRSPLGVNKGDYDELGFHIPIALGLRDYLPIELRNVDKDLAIAVLAVWLAENNILPQVLRDAVRATMKCYYGNVDPEKIGLYLWATKAGGIQIDNRYKEELQKNYKPPVEDKKAEAKSQQQQPQQQPMTVVDMSDDDDFDQKMARVCASSSSSSSSSSKPLSEEEDGYDIMKAPAARFRARKMTAADNSSLSNTKAKPQPAVPAPAPFSRPTSLKETKERTLNRAPKDCIRASEYLENLRNAIPTFTVYMNDPENKADRDAFVSASQKYRRFKHKLENEVRKIQMELMKQYYSEEPIYGLSNCYLKMDCNDKVSSKDSAAAAGGGAGGFRGPTNMSVWVNDIQRHMKMIAEKNDVRYFLRLLEKYRAPEIDPVSGKATKEIEQSGDALLVWDKGNIYLHQWVILSLASHPNALRDCLQAALEDSNTIPQLLAFPKPWCLRDSDEDYFTPEIFEIVPAYREDPFLKALEKRVTSRETISVSAFNNCFRFTPDAGDVHDIISKSKNFDYNPECGIPFEVWAHYRHIENCLKTPEYAKQFNVLPAMRETRLWMEYSDWFRDTYNKRLQVARENDHLEEDLIALLAPPPEAAFDVRKFQHGDAQAEKRARDLRKRLVKTQRQQRLRDASNGKDEMDLLAIESYRDDVDDDEQEEKKGVDRSSKSPAFSTGLKSLDRLIKGVGALTIDDLIQGNLGSSKQQQPTVPMLTESSSSEDRLREQPPVSDEQRRRGIPDDSEDEKVVGVEEEHEKEEDEQEREQEQEPESESDEELVRRMHDLRRRKAGDSDEDDDGEKQQEEEHDDKLAKRARVDSPRKKPRRLATADEEEEEEQAFDQENMFAFVPSD